MSDRYPIPAVEQYRVKDTIKKSLFITTMAHTPSVEAAREFIQSIKDEFPDANHNCWAYQAGPLHSTTCVGMSDDGEPHGTAGKPILSALLHGGVGELACVVTRYFGGIKLGTGGLVRAYSGMVKLGLETLPIKEKITPVFVEVIIDYSNVTLFKRMLSEYEAKIIHETFTADVRFEVAMPKEHMEWFIAAVVEMTNGEALVDVLEKEQQI